MTSSPSPPPPPPPPPPRKGARLPTELVLSGGGTNGVAMLGALDALYRQQRLTRVRRLVCASVGSIIGLLLVAGYVPRTIFDVLLRMDFAWFDELNCDSVLMFYDTLGAVDGDAILRLMRVMLEKQGVPESVTFAQLHRRTSIALVVTGYNVTEQRTDTFDHASHADMPVLLAIRISISIPLLFRPVEYGGQLYVDGGWLQPLPVARRPRRALAVSLVSVVYSDPPRGAVPLPMGDYLSLLFRDMGRLLLSRSHHAYGRCPQNLLLVRLRATSASQGRCLNLQMTREGKLDLFAQGTRAAVEHAARWWAAPEKKSPPKPDSS